MNENAIGEEGIAKLCTYSYHASCKITEAEFLVVMLCALFSFKITLKWFLLKVFSFFCFCWFFLT